MHIGTCSSCHATNVELNDRICLRCEQQLVEQASVPNLATLFRSAKSKGLIHEALNYHQ